MLNYVFFGVRNGIFLPNPPPNPDQETHQIELQGQFNTSQKMRKEAPSLFERVFDRKKIVLTTVGFLPFFDVGTICKVNRGAQLKNQHAGNLV